MAGIDAERPRRPADPRARLVRRLAERELRRGVGVEQEQDAATVRFRFGARTTRSRFPAHRRRRRRLDALAGSRRARAVHARRRLAQVTRFVERRNTSGRHCAHCAE